MCPCLSVEESSEDVDDDITYKNPMDATSSLLPDIDEKGCLIGQGDCIDDDSDEDYSSIQKSVFLVTGEPDFDSGPPDDGLEYLRRVRYHFSLLISLYFFHLNI